MTCGIYCLYYETDDFQYYIGESLNIEGRYLRHCRELATNKHPNYKLARGHKTFGFPSISIIENTSAEIIKEREVHWIQEYNSFYNGMNLTTGGEGCGYGGDHPRAVYQESTYINILVELSSTKDNFTEIANRLRVDKDIVTNIASGASHTYLAESYPEEYALMMRKKGSRCVGSVPTKDKLTYYNIFIDLVHTNLPMKSIADKFGVSNSIVMDISKGKSHLYLKKEYPVLYSILEGKRGVQSRFAKLWPKVVSPDGVVYTIENSALFAREQGIDSGGLSRVLNGKQLSVKGWKVYVESV